MVELVTYSDEIEKAIVLQAQERIRVKAEKGKRITRRRSFMSNLEMARRWVAAQYCVTKYFGNPIDLSAVVDANHNAPHLFIDRYSAIVRNPSYEEPIIKFDSIDYFPTFFAVLCSEPAQRTVAIHGCVSKQRFIKEHTRSKLNHEEWDCLIMHASQLTPIAKWEREVELASQLGLDL